MAFYGYCGPAAILYILKTTQARLRTSEVGKARKKGRKGIKGSKGGKGKLRELAKHLPTLVKLGDDLSTSAKLGTHHEDMVKYLKKQGFKVRVREGAEWKDIKHALDAGAQVLLDWWTDIGDPGQDLGHYSVATTCGRKFLTIYDPDINKKRRIGRDRFVPRWHDVGADGGQLNQWMAEIRI